MTNRTQVLRSSVTGNAPASATRAPGELWINFPDLQLGLIDAARNSQKLIAVRYFSTTANYAIGDFVVQAGALYVANAAVTAGAFNATKWNKLVNAVDIATLPYLPLAGGTLTGALLLAADPGAPLGAATKQYVDGKVTAAPFLPLAGGTMLAPITLSGPPSNPLHAVTKAYVDGGAFVPLAGGTMTGDLILNRDPQVALGAATKQYVDVRPAIGDNRIINGDMRWDQRNNGASVTPTVNPTYTLDRWMYGMTQPSKFSLRQLGPSALTIPFGFPYFLQATSLSAFTPAATDTFYLGQKIEGDMLTDFLWGTASAQPVTLSFWANTTVAGTYSGVICNGVGDRAYPFTFALAGTGLQKVVVAIPGDTGGTWTLSGNATGMQVRFDLGSGANFRTAAGAWVAGNYVGATGAVNICATNGGVVSFTGVKLEIGSVATPYNRQSLAKSLADCQRYWQSHGVTMMVQGYNGPGAAVYNSFLLPVAMRAAPTVSYFSTAYTNASGIATNSVSIDALRASIIITAVGYGYAATGFTLDAEI